ncbi:helix-turn-helix domain-containing protein [Sinorhizobium meliloti]|uniref:helix-turn-helix domain-containing protein n=1 Tax=Rhizobium meliloti TaxID=382 RepID=UPI000379E548|nr:helix-turn-helix domain-containing protein [Sinorhizobium meliloti]MDE3759834.1 helix-turn-helix domain-containing protein [Sinorhizobium meliloti]
MNAGSQFLDHSFHRADNFAAAEIPGPRLVFTYKAGRSVYAAGDSIDNCYQVVTGAVRSYHLLSDGRRQVVSFYLPGEIFGFEAGSEHRLFAEATTDTGLVVFGRRRIQQHSGELLALALAGMASAQQHLLMVGRKRAVERVAAFLIDLCERQGGGRHLRLPMVRQDIADYLGLSMETVSREITKLRKQGVIALRETRAIDISKPEALRLLCT